MQKTIVPGYSPEKFLQFLDLAEFGVDGLKIRRAALLLFANDIIRWHPRCSVRVIRVRGTELGTGRDYNVAEDDIITGNIVSILENAWDALRPHLAQTKFQANALFRESIIYPEEACRETLINAIAHRDYSIEGKPVEILIFDDRMEVRSPGRLLSSISVNDLKELTGAHQSRNVFIARVLRELGYMREMGEGIRRIYSSVRTFELVDPEISSDQNSFVVTLFHKSIFSPRDVQWFSGFSEFHLSKDEQRVVLLGRDGRLLSTNDITQIVGIVDTKDFTQLYNSLNQKGIIFNTKPGIHLKRSTPRFQIRPPQEAQQYLEELERALYKIGPIEIFSREVISRLKYELSLSSPYYRNPGWSLKTLGYINEYRTPLPRTNSIWSRVPTHDLKKSDREYGEITTLFPERGFGFARITNGEEFYLHVYQFIDKDEWPRLKEGSKVEFKPGERNLPGKQRAAKAIQLKD